MDLDIGGLMLRRPIYRPKGTQAFKKGRELIRAFSGVTAKSRRTFKQNADLMRDRNETSPNGSADGVCQDAGGGVVVPTPGHSAGDMEHVPTPCVVLLVPERRPPSSKQRVTKEGGLIRFGLGGGNDRALGRK
jgi:hypothetical protein